MSDTKLTASALSLALCQIDSTRWGVPKDVVDYVRASTVDVGDHTGYVEVSRHELARWLGIGHRYAYRVLNELVAGRVLLVDPGRGSRAAAYRVNPDVAQWRGVDEEGRLVELPWRWRVGPELARRRVADVAAERRATGTDGFAARRVAPQTDFPARPIAQLPSPTCAPRRAANATVAARPIAQQIPDDDAAHCSSSFKTSSSSSFEEDEEVAKSVEQVAAAITAKTRGPVLGQLRHRLAEALRRRDVDWVLQLVAEAPAGLRPPGIVAAVEQAPVRPGTASERRRRSDRAYLERMIATHRQLGDHDIADDLAAQLAELDQG